VEWEDADEILPLAAVSILSVEDLPDSSMIEDFAKLARLLVVTDGPNGCTVYWNNEVRAFPAPTVKAVDLTGAGDVFAAAYLVRLFQTGGDAWDAAEFANRVAACSVTRSGLLGKATAIRRLLAEETRQEAEEN
jgi:sugar/nucleoside kinase (ribokinase family)